MKLLLALVAGALGYCYKCGLDARTKRTSIKEQVNRWEGEGGNVPSVATPSPVPPGQSYGTHDPVVRH